MGSSMLVNISAPEDLNIILDEHVVSIIGRYVDLKPLGPVLRSSVKSGLRRPNPISLLHLEFSIPTCYMRYIQQDLVCNVSFFQQLEGNLLCMWFRN